MTATVALFLAVSGGMAWALANNSVRSRHIQDLQVKNQDLANPSVNGNKVFADSLGGQHIDEGSLAEVPQASSADDAGTLDGIDSTQFIKGGGTARGGAAAVAPGAFITFLEVADPGIRLAYSCPAANITANNGILRIRNISGAETVNLFSDNGGSNPNHYGELAPDATFDQFGAAAGEYVTLGVQGSYQATLHVFSVHRASDDRCHVQAQMVVTK